MNPEVRILFRGIFLIVLGIGVFGFGAYYAAKAPVELKWAGIIAVMVGLGLFLFGSAGIVSLLWRYCGLTLS